MNNLLRNSIYQGKNIYRDYGFLFWSLLYPIIMAVFFYTAFSGFTNMELENVEVGIEENNPIALILETIDILNVEKMDLNQGEKELENENIDGFIKNDMSLVVNESGLNQTVIKSILEQIVQTNALNRPLEKFDYDVDYLIDKNQKANGILVIFYSLIGMVSTYGVFSGIEIVHYIQSNLSTIGARINTTPIKKQTFLISGVIVGLLLNIAANTILLLFIEMVLKLDLIRSIGYSVVFILLGNLFGLSLGILIGVSNKKGVNFKTMMAVMSTLFLSALAGLMSPNIKTFIDLKAPILSRINPIAIITSNLYRINLLENTSSMIEGIGILIIYILILSIISLIALRRRQYDSI